MNVRAMIWFALMGVVCVCLVATLFTMQIIEYDKYQSQVIDNIQQEREIPAKRGLIYDRNMIALATNSSTFRIFVSPVDIQAKDAKDKNGKNYANIVSAGLSEILGMEYDEIYVKTQKINRKDETVKRNVDAETKNKVADFIKENELSDCIYVEEFTKRYYPYSSLGASVIGVTGTDGGLLGVELQYNKYLTGTPGRYITTKNAQSQSMPSKFDTYIEPKNGLSVVTTIDASIQSMLEEQLEQTYYDSQAANKVSGIVMNPTTGEIYAMGTYPSFDLNDPYTLDEGSKAALESLGLDKDSKEYNEEYWKLLYGLWNNKAVSYLYEPGSTMKMMTTAMALEENAVKFTDVFTCSGKMAVSGTTIHCHLTRGHGSAPFSTMLQKSCNPTIMSVAARLGASKFYSYFEAFGYTSKTGIDLPGEESGLYVALSGFNSVELACYSFGQTFKTTLLQQITAVSTVANGGNLVTPRVVSALVDESGNTVVSYNTEYKKQVVSKDVCQSIMNVLENGVSSGNGVKNAYIAGYKIAAKTGTSEKRDSADKSARVGSCVAIAPADDPQVTAIIIVDEPQISNRYGSNVAAPYVAALLEQVLPYLGIERQYTDEEMSRIAVKVGDYKAKSLEKAIKEINKLGVEYEVVGEGQTVTKQIPAAGQTLTNINGKIILFTGGVPADKMTEVPKVTDMSVTSALQLLASKNLNVLIEGASNYTHGSGATVISQSAEPGTMLHEWDVVTIVCRYLDDSDETVVN